MRIHTLTLGLALGIGLYGCWQIAAAGLFHGKAFVAPHLISSAWAKTLSVGAAVKPWPWADTWPVAYVKWETGDEAYPVLAGAMGRTLAFAPGHLNGSSGPGEPGLMVIAGHRDTHFTHLKDVRAGARFSVQNSSGAWHRYQVTETKIVHSDDRALIDSERSRVVFVTCWPFETTDTNGPLRYAVFADQDG